MALNDYQNLWGPRWHVRTITGSPTEITVNDGLMFVGDGVGGTDCKLVNVTTGVEWGLICTHKTTGDQVFMKRNEPDPKRDWTITRSQIGTSGRYRLEATSSSGGGSWTATEG